MLECIKAHSYIVNYTLRVLFFDLPCLEFVQISQFVVHFNGLCNGRHGTHNGVSIRRKMVTLRMSLKMSGFLLEGERWMKTRTLMEKWSPIAPVCFLVSVLKTCELNLCAM